MESFSIYIPVALPSQILNNLMIESQGKERPWGLWFWVSGIRPEPEDVWFSWGSISPNRGSYPFKEKKQSTWQMNKLCFILEGRPFTFKKFPINVR